MGLDEYLPIVPRKTGERSTRDPDRARAAKLAMMISRRQLTHAHGRVNILLHLALNVGIVAVA